MKYMTRETLMRHALPPTLFRWLKEQKPEWNIAGLKKKAKRICIGIVARTHGIGKNRVI